MNAKELAQRLLRWPHAPSLPDVLEAAAMLEAQAEEIERLKSNTLSADQVQLMIDRGPTRY